MGISLFSFTITVEVGFRTFIVGTHRSFLIVVLRHVNDLVRRRHVDVANFARKPVFAQFLCFAPRGESIGTVGIEHAGLIVSYEELYVPMLQEVQNLEENRDCLVLSFGDGRQVLFLYHLQDQSCGEEVRVHFGIKAPDSIIVVLELTRNVQGTQPEKR